MLDTLLILPFPFWPAAILTIYFCLQAWGLRNQSVGLPMLAVLGTVSFWYFGDVLYNDYADYRAELKESALQAGWWEILLFVVVFGWAAPWVHRKINRSLLRRPSNAMYLIRNPGAIKASGYQRQIDVIFTILLVPWAILMGIALLRTNFDFVGLFAPYLSDKTDPWARGRLGGGFDSLVAAASYLQIGLVSVFGVIAAISTRPRTLCLVLIICAVMMPGYVLDRTRSTMLVTVLPGFLAFALLRFRVPIFVRVIVIILGFLAMDSWLKFVMQVRGTDQTVISALVLRMNSKIVDSATEKHLGLNMFEELGFINGFMDDGTFRPDFGAEYFSEIVNPIPRAIWHDKPMIGIDYAIARGLSYNEMDAMDAGVGATVSTGMIGQGVVNFGQILGPVAAAVLMALWVTLLARQDLLGSEFWRLLAYALGLILTFNMGRDVTLLVTYPFFFFWLGFFILSRYFQGLRARLGGAAVPQEARTISPLRLAKVGHRGHY